jgi:hypothetical protein
MDEQFLSNCKDKRLLLRSLGRFLYCRLKEAVDVNADLKKARLFLGVIKQHFTTPEDRNYLQELLTLKQWEDLRRLVEIARTGHELRLFADSTGIKSRVFPNYQITEYEKEIRERILKDPSILEGILGPIERKSFYKEKDFEEYGKCDLYCLGSDTAFPIEIKDEIADHKVIGQIQKYIKGSIVYMRHGGYNWIQGVVIAPTFNPDAVVELTNQGIISLMITLETASYRLHKL